LKLKHMLGITVLAVGTAIFGLAAPALASGQYCTASNGNFSACTDVNGENSAINWASANATSSTAITEEVHVELVNPQGDELCNSNTVSINKAGISLTCTWQAGGKDYLAGNYCTIVWRWEEVGYPIVGAKYEWKEVGPTNCLYVS
jgi:hypothetical protein